MIINLVGLTSFLNIKNKLKQFCTLTYLIALL